MPASRFQVAFFNTGQLKVRDYKPPSPAARKAYYKT